MTQSLPTSNLDFRSVALLYASSFIKFDGTEGTKGEIDCRGKIVPILGGIQNSDDQDFCESISKFHRFNSRAISRHICGEVLRFCVSSDLDTRYHMQDYLTPFANVYLFLSISHCLF